MAEPSTQSHALAEEAAAAPAAPLPAVEGGIHLAHDESSVIDLGWHEDSEPAADPVVDGIRNEDVWLLIRRFNNTVFHLKATPKAPVGGLDLTVAADEEFSPNKMRSQLERLYMGMIIGMLVFLKHVSRLRSWREARRTALFCTVYFVVWALDYLGFLAFGMLTALVVSPQVRRFLFPSFPVALVDSLSGGTTKPNAGVLGSVDSVTGAPENTKGEAVENEASNFVTALGSIAINVVMGADPQGEPNTEEDSINPPIPEPNKLATMVATAKDKAQGVDKPSQDKSKVPMETILWSKMQPMMHYMTMVSDIWEKAENLLNPKAPFHPNYHRLRLASLIVPLAASSVLLSRDIVVRGSTFVMGAVFFGDPLIRRASYWLGRNVSNWTDVVNINNNIFGGVPTHSQLALTLLRLGEARKAPIPPPPHMTGSPSKDPVELSTDVLGATGGDQPLGASYAELEKAAEYDEETFKDAGGEDGELTQNDGKKHKKVLSLIKGSVKAAVQIGAAFDKARGKAGNDAAKRRAGVIPTKNETTIAGPAEFSARYEGQKGYVYLNTLATPPYMAFSTQPTAHGDGATDERDPNVLWRLPVNKIADLRKHSGWGFKTKMMAGWSMNKELYDSLGISDTDGNAWAVTAIPCRDVLFNRLIAIGDQRWEAC